MTGRMMPGQVRKADLRGVSSGRVAALRGFRRGVKRVSRASIAAWVAENRVVSPQSDSPYPGPWDHARAPHLVEMMDVCGLDDPCTEVVNKKSAQTAGSEWLLNVALYASSALKTTVGYVLPTQHKIKDFNRLRLDCTIEDSPRIKAVFVPARSRNGGGSTALHKKWRGGGNTILAGANVALHIKSISAQYTLRDEVTEFPWDTDGQGEPNSLLDKRDLSYRRSGYKRLWNSTPDREGACRIDAKFEESDQRRRYIRCPHCGAYQTLRWVNFRFNDVEPYDAYFLCAAEGCGGVIGEEHHDAILAGQVTERVIQSWGDQAEETIRLRVADGSLGAVWIKTYPGDDCPGPVIMPEDMPSALLRRRRGRVVGFAIWTAYSMTVPFDELAHEWVTSRGKPAKEKDFVRQTLGEPYRISVNVPDSERLVACRQSYVLGGGLPKGVLFLTMTVDVQDKRLEWAVYGWGIGLSGWLVDKGIIEGQTDDDAVWARLDGVISRRYRDAGGRSWPVDAIGVDTGFRTQRVYRWVMGHAATGRVFALDGRDGWKMPALGTPSRKDVDFLGAKIGEVQLWPVGTWDMKTDHYAALGRLLDGPDAAGKWPAATLFYPDACDREYFEQLTAEYLKESFDQWGRPVSRWVRRSNGKPNEALDLAVYGRALAHHLSDSLQPADWKALVAARAADPKAGQLDLDDYARRLEQARADGAGEPAATEPDQPPQPAENANAIRTMTADPWGRGRSIFDRFGD